MTEDGPDDGGTFKIGDIPRHVQDEIGAAVSNFTVGLVAVENQGSPVKPTFCGSGTLVTAFGRMYVLTAKHVWERLNEAPRLGMVVTKGYGSAWTMPREGVRVTTLGERNAEEWGPDLAFLEVPPAVQGGIKARKSTYDLERRREIYRTTAPDFERGPWALVGGLAEWSEFGETSAILRIQTIVTMGFPVDRPGEWDYVEATATYNDGSRIPQRFGGMSGGGFWFVPASFSPSTGVFKWTGNFILEGVVFYETPIENDERRIRCHGRRTLALGLDALERGA